MTSEANPHYFATNTKDDTSIDQITDAVDFPHTGLIKALSLGMKGNYAVKGSATDFDITQSATSSSVVVVKSGKIFRDGALHTVPSNGADTTFADTSFQATANTHHLLVADSSNVLQIRKHGSSTQNAIPPYDDGDTIIAVITHTSDGFNDMTVQYLTTSKVANNVSIGYGTSAYTETASISGASGGTTITNSVGDLIIDNTDTNDQVAVRLGTDTSATGFEVRNNSDVVKFTVTGEGKVGIGESSPTTMLHLTDSAGGSPTITIENTGTAASEPEIVFTRTGTAAQSQDIGHIKWKAKDDGGATHNYASVFADAQDETAGTEDGRLLFNVTKGGTDNVEILRLSGSEGFVFNDSSNDLNFRIESNGNANILFVDGGNDNVGIGTNTNDANAILTVEGAISLDEISAPSNTANRGQLYTNADNHLHFINGAGTDVKVTEEVFIVALSDETTDLTTGTGKASFHMPFAMTLTGVKANCTTAPAGATIIVDINEAGSTILSTKLSIDASETTSATAASAAVISDTALADDALITFDIDQVGSSTAGKGLKVTLYGVRA